MLVVGGEGDLLLGGERRSGAEELGKGLEGGK